MYPLFKPRPRTFGYSLERPFRRTALDCAIRHKTQSAPRRNIPVRMAYPAISAKAKRKN
jgi:hypothetical protein